MSKGWSAFCCLRNFGTFVFNGQLYLVFAIYLAVGSICKNCGQQKLWPTLAEVIFVKTRSYGFIAAL
jgi:hypothetical protein